jgi:hypothetical protein
VALPPLSRMAASSSRSLPTDGGRARLRPVASWSALPSSQAAAYSKGKP